MRLLSGLLVFCFLALLVGCGSDAPPPATGDMKTGVGKKNPNPKEQPKGRAPIDRVVD